MFSCFNHPNTHGLLIRRQHYYDLCDENSCASDLLSLFDYWTKCRQLDNELLLARAPNKKVNLWMRETLQKLQAVLGQFDSYCIDTIRKAIALLVCKGFLKVRDTRSPWDRAKLYELNIPVIQEAIEDWEKAQNPVTADVLESVDPINENQQVAHTDFSTPPYIDPLYDSPSDFGEQDSTGLEISTEDKFLNVRNLTPIQPPVDPPPPKPIPSVQHLDPGEDKKSAKLAKKSTFRPLREFEYASGKPWIPFVRWLAQERWLGRQDNTKSKAIAEADAYSEIYNNPDRAEAVLWQSFLDESCRVLEQEKCKQEQGIQASLPWWWQATNSATKEKLIEKLCELGAIPARDRVGQGVQNVQPTLATSVSQEAASAFQKAIATVKANAAKLRGKNHLPLISHEKTIHPPNLGGQQNLGSLLDCLSLSPPQPEPPF